jgi:Flp pilus assembly protein TadB
MNSAMTFGAGIGIGCILLFGALRPPRRPLAAVMRDLERRRTAADASGRASRLAQRLAAAGGPGVARHADLEVVGRTFQQHAIRKLAAACILGALPPVTVALLAAGGVIVGPAAALVPAVALCAAGYVLPDVELRGMAAERRAAFVHALSGYLDVTAVLLAGGAGTETALHAAARLGNGWPFQRLRAALERCRLTGQTPWDTFGELGDRLDVTELSQLATSLQLAGEHGARVRLTLTDRARALRTRQLADAEARARTVTEQMSVPVALLAVAFMLFVGFPAVWVVLGEL